MQNLRLNTSLAKFNKQMGLESSDIKMKCGVRGFNLRG